MYLEIKVRFAHQLWQLTLEKVRLAFCLKCEDELDFQGHGSIQEETKDNLLEAASLGVAESEVHVWETSEDEDDAS